MNIKSLFMKITPLPLTLGPRLPAADRSWMTRSKPYKTLRWGWAALLAAALPQASATLILDPGNVTLTGGLATPQTFTLYVDNTSPTPVAVGALDFFIQLGNGQGTSPAITGIDLEHGTVFDGHSSGQTGDPSNSPQLLFFESVKSVGTTLVLQPALNKLATISIVTTGMSQGQLPLLLSVPGVGETAYLSDTASPFPLAMDILSGTLKVVSADPVPDGGSTAALLLAPLLILGCQRCRQTTTRTLVMN
jgi:hypothetical protein